MKMMSRGSYVIMEINEKQEKNDIANSRINRIGAGTIYQFGFNSKSQPTMVTGNG